MAISKSDFSRYIRGFQFRELLNEMGWNNDRTKQTIVVGGVAYTLIGIAEKSGFRVFVCETPSGQNIPSGVTRKTIEKQVTKLFQEHLIIFIDGEKKKQIWQLAVRKAGSPVKISETRYDISQDPELLYQRAGNLFFTLDEEEKITIVDVTKRVAENFQQNNEQVTKKFYESFKKHHTAFLKFIQGMEDTLEDKNNDKKKWYASLMLNRLMFCYFIQKKGFLDNNRNYLQDKLKECQEKKGKDNFYSFYRNFLLVLFHQGLGTPEHSALEVAIGKVPYLNGGLFDVHELEKAHQNIAIDDEAFKKIFDFFDEYEWHLDTRENASGKDINPDVIGYIFEKYINDRASMGAYYTKEDITDYISKNCIIPWLFDEVKRQYPQAFEAEGWLWTMLKNSGDTYIYDAVKHGISNADNSSNADNTSNSSDSLFADLPEEICRGFCPELDKKIVDGNGPWLWELRKDWNKPAPSEIALPTEIYREVIERRKRYAEVKGKITGGKIKEIADFITYNLNIRQFVQDVLEETSDAKFIQHFYKALCNATILDPTCGSGAFLFAAMNILEPLYEACINRMQDFVEEATKGKHKFFEKTLSQIHAPDHPNLQYFIYKAIILNNLYGVDIMKEATEIAKLRLFLKLMATGEADYNKPNLGLEPLPDVDFNIRAGNTLIGYATETQLKDGFSGTLDFENDEEKIKEKCDIVARAFARYKEIQLKGNSNFSDFKQAKDDLNLRLDALRKELDDLLHKQYYEKIEYNRWLATHQPFHWFAEFYEIIAGKGGFDVIIGNPPYVEYAKIKKVYQIFGYETEECGNLYAFVVERCFALGNKIGRIGMIIPHSAICTDRMQQIQQMLKIKKEVWLTTYCIRPAKLFAGVDQRLAIYLLQNKTDKSKMYSSNYHHWYEEYRQHLFMVLQYSTISDINFSNSLPKIHIQLEKKIWKNISLSDTIEKYLQSIVTKNNLVYYHNAPRYWIRAMDTAPYFSNERDGESISTQIKNIPLPDAKKAMIVVATFNSSLFYWWFILLSDCRHLNLREIIKFPLSLEKISSILQSQLIQLTNDLMEDFNQHKQTKECMYKSTGKVTYDEFYPRLSKPIIDKIDCLLAQHYGFTHEELDFIINYDIKYRMGKELNNDEESEDEE